MSPATFSTCDLCDANEADTSGALRVLPPVLRDFGVPRAFSGPVATLRCLEDNSRVREAVNSPGLGRVLVVDGLPVEIAGVVVRPGERLYADADGIVVSARPVV